MQFTEAQKNYFLLKDFSNKNEENVFRAKNFNNQIIEIKANETSDFHFTLLTYHINEGRNRPLTMVNTNDFEAIKKIVLKWLNNLI